MAKTHIRRTPEQRMEALEHEQAKLAARIKREAMNATEYGPAVLRAARAIDAACDALGEGPHEDGTEVGVLASALNLGRAELRDALVGVGVAVR